MTVDQILTAIGNLGFPVFVAVYLLVFVNRTVKSNTQAINSLAKIITQLCEKLNLK